MLAANTFAQAPRIDSMVVAETDTLGHLSIFGSFGTQVGSVWIDTVSLPVERWTDSLIVSSIARYDHGNGSCGSVHMEVGTARSNIRVLTRATIFGRVIMNTDTIHAQYFNDFWRYDFHSFFLNHKNDDWAPSMVAYYFGNNSTVAFNFRTRIAGLTVANLLGVSVVYLGMDSNLTLLSRNQYRSGNASINYTLSEWCSAPMTAQMIYRGVTLAAPLNNSMSPDTENVALHWQQSQYFDTYELRVSSDSTFSTHLVDTTVTPSQFTIPILESKTTYYWCVRGLNSEGQSRWSPVWHFTTSRDPAGVEVLASSELAFSCTPNPATNILNITLPAPSRVVLYDLRGNVVRSIATSEPSVTIETRDIASGMYIVGVTTSGMHGSQLVQIQH